MGHRLPIPPVDPSQPTGNPSTPGSRGSKPPRLPSFFPEYRASGVGERPTGPERLPSSPGDPSFVTTVLHRKIGRRLPTPVPETLSGPLQERAPRRPLGLSEPPTVIPYGPRPPSHSAPSAEASGEGPKGFRYSTQIPGGPTRNYSYLAPSDAFVQPRLQPSPDPVRRPWTQGRPRGVRHWETTSNLIKESSVRPPGLGCGCHRSRDLPEDPGRVSAGAPTPTTVPFSVSRPRRSRPRHPPQPLRDRVGGRRDARRVTLRGGCARHKDGSLRAISESRDPQMTPVQDSRGRRSVHGFRG